MKFLRRLLGQTETNSEAASRQLAIVETSGTESGATEGQNAAGGLAEAKSNPTTNQVAYDGLPESHLLFLTNFLFSQSVSALLQADMTFDRWTAVLGSDCFAVVKDLERRGFLTRPTVAQRLEGELTLLQLRELCRKQGLKVYGKKSELVAQLVESGFSDLESLSLAADSYVCSEPGREIAQSYKRKKKAEKTDAQIKSADLLDAHDFVGAVKIVCDYEARQVFQRDTGVDWSSGTAGLSTIKSIYTAQKAFLRNVPASNLENIRFVAALDYLWGEAVDIIDVRDIAVRGCKFNLGVAARQLQLHHDHGPRNDNVDGHRQPVEAKYLAVYGDCSACMARDGERYKMGQLPDLPSEECTCASGCRCTFGYRADDGVWD